MTNSRIVENLSHSIVKKSGKCPLDEEILRFDIYRINGINVPDLYFYDREKDIGVFEKILINENQEIEEEYMFKRGEIEGIMARNNMYHPFFPTSFDDTIWDENKKMYLIDADEQIPIVEGNVFLGLTQIQNTDEFKQQVLPTLSYNDLYQNGYKGLSSAYLQGYERGLDKPISLELSNTATSYDLMMRYFLSL